jgi:hypothetical protein
VTVPSKEASGFSGRGVIRLHTMQWIAVLLILVTITATPCPHHCTAFGADTHTSRSALFPCSGIPCNLSPLILRLLCLICVGPLRLLTLSGRSILCRIDNVTLRVFHNMDTSLSTVLVAPCGTDKHHGAVPDCCRAACLKAKKAT